MAIPSPMIMPRRRFTAFLARAEAGARGFGECDAKMLGRVQIYSPDAISGHHVIWRRTAMNWLFAPFAVLLGVVLTTQVATNAQLGKALGNEYIPAAVNMAIGLIATTVLTWSLTSEWPSREIVRAAPWYAWLAGGLMGTVYLTGNILLAPRLGAGELVGLVVAGQLLFSVLLDHFGWIGFAQHAANPARLAGCALMIAGVFLISKF
jgi:transporter family-2 protein